jgi:hypothetical protein
MSSTQHLISSSVNEGLVMKYFTYDTSIRECTLMYNILYPIVNFSVGIHKNVMGVNYP